mmetsp:Transcript_89620/g.192040  ORF Transcript_89620/g.192040 Transcript_89620/m.192040 type:complete len:115 (-) Transcript_89620:257-601(-)
MPTWKEKARKKLNDTCTPRLKMHFDSSSNVSFEDSSFMHCIKVLCESRGFKTIVSEHTPSGEFSRILFHDQTQELEEIPEKPQKKPKGKKAKEVKPVRQKLDPTAKVYNCWVLE